MKREGVFGQSGAGIFYDKKREPQKRLLRVIQGGTFYSSQAQRRMKSRELDDIVNA